MKKLYLVTVEFDYYVMAESEYDAAGFADEAALDSSLRDEACAEVVEAGHVVSPPHVPHELIYGTKSDIMLKDCIPKKETAS